MPQQRMKYQWFQRIPRHVTRREYQRYQLGVFAATGLGLMFALWWIPLGWLSWRMVRSAQSCRQEFVQRSNQAYFFGQRHTAT